MLARMETGALAGRASTIPLSRAAKLSYGAGEVGSNLAWAFVTGFLLLY
jgi:Na+/melibiose symporter-like transporter